MFDLTARTRLRKPSHYPIQDASANWSPLWTKVEYCEMRNDGVNMKWDWTLILLGGLFMVYGGFLDILVHFERTLPGAPPSWHSVDTRISLVCGLLVLMGAAYLILRSLQIRAIIHSGELVKLRPLLNSLLVVCVMGTIVDLIAGYYAIGFMIVLLVSVRMKYLLGRKKQL